MKQIIFISLFAYFLAGCTNQQDPSGHDHDHSTDSHKHESGEAMDTEEDHDHTEDTDSPDIHGEENSSDVKLQITAYSKNFEVFAEADPFIKGENSNILAHFSTLPGFRALETGKLLISINVGGNTVSETLNEPTRKGIFAGSLVPKYSGKGKIIFEIQSAEGKSDILSSDIEVFENEHDAIHEAEEQLVSTVNGIVFTKEQSWKIDFATALPQVGPFGELIKTSAQIRSSQIGEMQVIAKSNGIVVFSGKKILEGITVNERENLFTIAGTGLAEGSSDVRFNEAKNNFESTEEQYLRLKDLIEDKIVSDKDFREAESNYENAKLVYENLKKNFSSKGENVISAMTGYISEIFVQNGQYVEAGDPLLKIASDRSLLLHAEVQPKHYSKLKSIIEINLHVMESNSVYSLKELKGKILSVGQSLSDDNFMIPVHLEVEKRNDLIPGSFVEIYIKTLSDENALTIPGSAILEEQGNFFVLVQQTPELFEKRQVKIGDNDGICTQIVAGLLPSERVVSGGTTMVKLAQGTGALDAHSGHVH